MTTAVHTPNWALVDFDTAVVSRGVTEGSHVLTVTGETPRDGELSLGVCLFVSKKYLVQPEYTEIEVRFDTADAILQTVTWYRVSIPIDAIRGTKGIKVVGKSDLKEIDVP